MPSAQLLGRATRARTLPVMLAPVAVGAALAAVRAPFRWWAFALTLAGAALLHLAANVLNDFFDARSGVDKLARIDRSSIPTGSGLLESGQMTARAMLALAALLLAGAGAIGVWLAVTRGWAVLALGAVGALLAVQYVGPPARLAYRGAGLGEVVIFVAYGVLPVAGAYYVQTQRIDADALWAGVVPGLLTTLVLYHQHFLHWRADKAAGKVTPVVALGPDTALTVSGVAIVVVYVALVVQVAVRLFPPLALLGLLTAVPLGASWARALNDPAPQRYLNLLGATLGATVLTGAAIVVALAVA